MDKSIGAFWIQTGAKGEFWKGYIEDEKGNKKNVVVFRNNYKNDRPPDFRIFEAKKTEEVKKETEQFDICNDDDLPF